MTYAKQIDLFPKQQSNFASSLVLISIFLPRAPRGKKGRKCKISGKTNAGKRKLRDKVSVSLLHPRKKKKRGNVTKEETAKNGIVLLLESDYQ